MNDARKGISYCFLTAIAAAIVLLPTVNATAAEAAVSGQIIRHGIVVDFEASPIDGDNNVLVEGELTKVRFTLTEEATGTPVKGITPGVWMDIGENIQGQPGSQQKSCKDKIALYLKGVVGIRPMMDLNSYYVLIMNQEASLSIVDPLVSMAGVTSTLGQISLKGPGTDWVQNEDQKFIYVSMPTTGYVSVIDTDAFEVVQDIEAGEQPTRVAMQPDRRYLWVGNDATEEGQSGVTVIDTKSMTRVAQIPTGAGHHEIAFTADSSTAFVSNRDSGTVTVIDVASKNILKTIETGPLPISLDYSSLSEALYVADGRAGTVTVVDAQNFRITQQISLKPGLGPLRFSPDGRYALTVNPSENEVFVIDAASNSHVQTIKIYGQPYQVNYSRAFAYIRSLGTERVSTINLISLGKGKEAIVQGFDAGEKAPKLAGNLPLADATAFTNSEAAAFIVNPADNTTYLYMEGMNAAAGNYKVLGANARAVTIIDRSMREDEPGVFVATVKIPAAGRYDVAFMLETPELLHCFSADVQPNALIEKSLAGLAIEYLQDSHRVQAGSILPMRFRLTDAATGRPRSGLADVQVLYFRTPGADRTVIRAEETSDGIYEASLPIGRAGGYYIYVGVPSQKIGYDKLPYFTLAAGTQRAGQ